MSWLRSVAVEVVRSGLADELDVGREPMGTEAPWLKLSLCTQAARFMVGPFTKMGKSGRGSAFVRPSGNQEACFGQVNLEAPSRHSREMWSRRLERRGEVGAEIGSGDRECADTGLSPLDEAHSGALQKPVLLTQPQKLLFKWFGVGP